MDAGSGRLERAADRIYLILGIYRDKMPNEAVEALQGVAAALGAAQEPEQAYGETDVEWLLRQMETQDLATLRGIAKSFPCERNGCSPDKPAQVKQRVRNG